MVIMQWLVHPEAFRNDSSFEVLPTETRHHFNQYRGSLCDHIFQITHGHCQIGCSHFTLVVIGCCSFT